MADGTCDSPLLLETHENLDNDDVELEIPSSVQPTPSQDETEAEPTTMWLDETWDEIKSRSPLPVSDDPWRSDDPAVPPPPLLVSYSFGTDRLSFSFNTLPSSTDNASAHNTVPSSENNASVPEEQQAEVTDVAKDDTDQEENEAEMDAIVQETQHIVLPQLNAGDVDLVVQETPRHVVLPQINVGDVVPHNQLNVYDTKTHCTTMFPQVTTNTERFFASGIMTGNPVTCHLAFAFETRTRESAKWLRDQIEEVREFKSPAPDWMRFVYGILNNPRLRAMELRELHASLDPSRLAELTKATIAAQVNWSRIRTPPYSMGSLTRMKRRERASKKLTTPWSDWSEFYSRLTTMEAKWLLFLDSLEAPDTGAIHQNPQLKAISSQWPEQHRRQLIRLLAVGAVLFGNPDSMIQPIEIWLWAQACTTTTTYHARLGTNSNTDADPEDDQFTLMQPIATNRLYAVLRHPRYFLPSYRVLTSRQVMMMLGVLSDPITTVPASPMLSVLAFSGISVRQKARDSPCRIPGTFFNVATAESQATYIPRHRQSRVIPTINENYCSCMVCFANRGAKLTSSHSLRWNYCIDLCGVSSFVSLLQSALFTYKAKLDFAVESPIKCIVFRINECNQMFDTLRSDTAYDNRPTCRFHLENLFPVCNFIGLVPWLTMSQLIAFRYRDDVDPRRHPKKDRSTEKKQ